MAERYAKENKIDFFAYLPDRDQRYRKRNSQKF